MDEFNARLIAVVASILLQIKLENAAQEGELRRIGRRLQELSISAAGDVSCDRINQELGQGLGRLKFGRSKKMRLC